MTENFTKRAYLTLYNLLDLRFNKTSNKELGRLLSNMNPNAFINDTSADSACYEDFCDCADNFENNEITSAYSVSIKFLEMYCNDFGFEIQKVIDDISLKEYETLFAETNKSEL